MSSHRQSRRYRPIFAKFHYRITPVPHSPPFKLGRTPTRTSTIAFGLIDSICREGSCIENKDYLFAEHSDIMLANNSYSYETRYSVSFFNNKVRLLYSKCF
jgi:hypothetical protein